MNIEQMLRDAIERKIAKILKEEYGIEMSKEIADKLSKDDQDCEDYQIRLTNVGDHKIRVIKVVFNSMDVDLKTAKILVDQAPSVISPCLTFERATEIVKLLNDAGATARVEKIVCNDDPLDWTPIPSDEQDNQDEQADSMLERTVINSVHKVNPKVMEQKKYKLTKETMCFDGVTLHRIQALKDFGNVNAGELERTEK